LNFFYLQKVNFLKYDLKVGISGLICLGLSIRMAHKSLTLKLKARNKRTSPTISVRKLTSFKSSPSVDNILNIINSENKDNSDHPQFEHAEMKMLDYANNQLDNDMKFSYKKRRNLYLEDHKNDGMQNEQINRTLEKIYNKIEDKRVDKVYTIGCFDLFHHGHVQLIQRMRQLGKKVIVGVHDSRRLVNSIYFYG
jgi:hypothetical protein